MKRLIFICPTEGCDHWADARHVMCPEHNTYGKATPIQPQAIGDKLASECLRLAPDQLADAINTYMKETK